MGLGNLATLAGQFSIWYFALTLFGLNSCGLGYAPQAEQIGPAARKVVCFIVKAISSKVIHLETWNQMHFEAKMLTISNLYIESQTYRWIFFSSGVKWVFLFFSPKLCITTKKDKEKQNRKFFFHRSQNLHSFIF